MFREGEFINVIRSGIDNHTFTFRQFKVSSTKLIEIVNISSPTINENIQLEKNFESYEDILFQIYHHIIYVYFLTVSHFTYNNDRADKNNRDYNNLIRFTLDRIIVGRLGFFMHRGLQDYCLIIRLPVVVERIKKRRRLIKGRRSEDVKERSGGTTERSEGMMERSEGMMERSGAFEAAVALVNSNISIEYKKDAIKYLNSLITKP
jgi:hypothetical protein